MLRRRLIGGCVFVRDDARVVFRIGNDVSFVIVVIFGILIIFIVFVVFVAQELFHLLHLLRELGHFLSERLLRILAVHAQETESAKVLRVVMASNSNLDVVHPRRRRENKLLHTLRVFSAPNHQTAPAFFDGVVTIRAPELEILNGG